MELRTGPTTSTTGVELPARRIVRAFVAVIVVLNVLNAVGIAMGADTERTKYFLLALERNPSTWFSGALLGATGLGAFLVGRGRPDQRTWSAVAALFAVLSLDEVATFHEWLGAVPGIPGVGTRGWAGAGLVLAALVTIWLLRWALALELRLRLTLVVGGVLFLGGAIGFEVLAGMWESSHGSDARYWAISSVEENLELAGVLVVLRGLLDHLAGRPAPLSLRVTG